MHTQFKNIRWKNTNGYDIAYDINTVDRLRKANFRFINKTDILKTFEKKDIYI